MAKFIKRKNILSDSTISKCSVEQMENILKYIVQQPVQFGNGSENIIGTVS